MHPVALTNNHLHTHMHSLPPFLCPSFSLLSPLAYLLESLSSSEASFNMDKVDDENVFMVIADTDFATSNCFAYLNDLQAAYEVAQDCFIFTQSHHFYACKLCFFRGGGL